MIINRNNYETMVIDYLEGNLSSKEHDAFKLFLIDNPDIEEEVFGVMDATFPLDNISLKDKGFLKENSQQEFDRIDILLAKKLEGDLTAEENSFLTPLLANDAQVIKSWEFLKLTKLKGNSIESFSFDFLKIPKSVDYSVIDNLIVGSLEGDLNIKQQKELEQKTKQNPTLLSEIKYFGLTQFEKETIVYPEKAKLKKAVVIPLWKIIAPIMAVAASLLLGVFMFNSPDNPQFANTINKHDGLHVTRVVNMNNENLSIDNSESNQTTNHIVGPGNDGGNDFANNKIENKQEIIKKNVPTRKSFVELQPIESLASQTIKVTVVEQNIIDNTIEVINQNPIIDNQLASAETKSNKRVKKFDSLRAFAIDKSKEILWGNDEFPEDNYTVALINKKGENSSLSDNFPVISNDDSGWSFSIGKFSVKKNKQVELPYISNSQNF